MVPSCAWAGNDSLLDEEHIKELQDIVIYANDMRNGDCTVNNPESKIPTPHIDRLAKEGWNGLTFGTLLPKR